MSRKRLDGRGGLAAAAAAAAVGLLAESHTPISADPLDAVFEVTGELGRGKFAVVKRCVEKATGKVFAAKFLRKRRRGRDCRAEVVHEMAVLESARNNPRVVNLHAAYETDHDIVLVLEYAAGGEIFEQCVCDEPLPEADVTRLIRQMLEGVDELHRSNLVHLDLKVETASKSDGLRLAFAFTCAFCVSASEHPPDQPGAARRHQNCRLWPGTQIGRRRGAPRDSWHTRVCGARNPELRAHHNVGRSLERGRHRLHAGDGRVSVRRRRQAGDLPQRVPGQRGLRPRRLLESLRARRGLHPQAAGQSARGPSQRGRVHRPPVAVAASAVVRRAGARPRRPRAQLRCQVGGAPARGQGELPAAAAAAFPRQTLPLGRGGASRRR
ncbi:serine/threonine-protein kinase 17B isoform X2 [Vanacampus margaritifer]